MRLTKKTGGIYSAISIHIYTGIDVNKSCMHMYGICPHSRKEASSMAALTLKIFAQCALSRGLHDFHARVLQVSTRNLAWLS